MWMEDEEHLSMNGDVPAPPSSWLSCLNTFPSVHVVALIWVSLSSCNCGWGGKPVEDCMDDLW